MTLPSLSKLLIVMVEVPLASSRSTLPSADLPFSPVSPLAPVAPVSPLAPSLTVVVVVLPLPSLMVTV